MTQKRSRDYLLRKLKREGFDYKISDSGLIEPESNPSLGEICLLYDFLRKKGFECVFVTSELTESVRFAINIIVRKNLLLRTSLSFYISDLISIDYSYLNEYFRQQTGKSIDQYYNERKESTRYLNRLSVLEVPDRTWNTSWWILN